MARKKNTDADPSKKTKRGRGKKEVDGAGQFSRSDANKVIAIPLDKFSMDNYGRYGRSVLEDRAIPDFRDGMNPVNRRVLWSAHTLGINSKSKFVKAARIVGDVLGRYHPHGDSAAYGAMVGMTNVGRTVNNVRVGLIEGEGNWGSLSGLTAAAMRYTEARLSKFSDEVLFNKFYLPAMQRVPNFDSSTVEPLVLPALLPVLFLNGRFGIAPGATTSIPSFEGNSVLALLKLAYEGEELTPKLLSKTLTAVTTYGGTEITKKEEGRTALFSGKKGSVTMQSYHEYDERKRTITFTKFANYKFEKIIEKVMAFEGVQSVQDMSTPKDKYGKLVVTLKRQGDHRTPKLVKRVVEHMQTKESYVLNFTRRSKDDLGQSEASMIAMPLVKAFSRWVKWRISLEQKACGYWIREDEKEIRRIDLLMQAVDLIDFIVKLLKDKKLKSNDEVYKAYAAKAKVEFEEAKYVLGRPIISLRNMSKADLLAQRKQVEKNKAKLEKRKKKPLPHMIAQLEDFRPYFKD